MFEVTKDKAQQFKVLSALMKDKRVTELVCATDAGREGELIFRLVYNKTGCTKPFKRLWISSLEDSAIREGFNYLRDGKEYDRLYEAALSRSKALDRYSPVLVSILILSPRSTNSGTFTLAPVSTVAGFVAP